METKSNKLLSCISYWSIFFAPFVLPILIWIFSDRPTSHHAKIALLNHLGGVIFYFLGMTGFYFSQVILEKPYNHQIMFSNILLGCTFICLFIAISLAIYNLMKGFQLLLQG